MPSPMKPGRCGRDRTNADLGREFRRFGRHLGALARAVEFPTVIEAPDLAPLDESDRELRAAMRAALRHDVRNAVLAAIKREVFAQRAQRLGRARSEFVAAVHG
jgi:hypothetical protein